MTDPTPTVVVPILEGVGFAAGRHVMAPMIAATLDAPDTRTAITRTALLAGGIIGACIALGVLVGRRL